MRPLLIVDAPGTAIVPFGFEVLPLLPRREVAQRYPIHLARRAAAALPLGGRVAVILGRHIAQAVLARGVWADVEMAEWSRTQRTDEAGDLRVLRYAVLPYDTRDVRDATAERVLAEAFTITDRVAAGVA